MTDLTRRQTLGGLSALTLAGLAPRLAFAADSLPTGDIAMGAADAPVEVIEYASFTCPHCAAFHRDTWPELKAAYVETGKARFVMREVYFDRFGLWGSMIARSGGERAFYPIVEQILAAQKDWTQAADPIAELRKIARLNGVSNRQIDTALTVHEGAEVEVIDGLGQFDGQKVIVWAGAESSFSDLLVEDGVLRLPAPVTKALIAPQAFVMALLTAYQTNSQAHGIEATPSFVINGETHRGNTSFAEMSQMIEAAL